jgi:NNP family nitrate/nitrite transporter-like MFS transporter
VADKTANRVLTMNILMFALCFAAWTLFGVLVTFLVDHRVLVLDKSQVGWLIGAPILTGSLMRLPVGLLSDRYGGKVVTVAIMLVGAFGLLLTSRASGFTSLLACGLVFGLTGATFASGVALTSSWFPKEKQGRALGLLGLGNIGTAITALSAPLLLKWATNGGEEIEGWRTVPLLYAGALVVMAIAFALLATGKKQTGPPKTIGVLLKPLKQVRVWRFGLYYFLVFGGFVALSQWLIPYSLNVYGLSLASAGVLSTMFSMPSAFTRAIGGFVSDRFGARTTLYCVLSGVLVLFILLVMPRMEITSPGEGVLADRPGTVSAVTAESVTVDATAYPLKQRVSQDDALDSTTIVWPQFSSWHEPAVQVGDSVTKKQVLARGVTHIYFQANRTVFTVILLLAGVLMGLGMAAVFKYIPEYFPNDVPVVGGLVGVIGGLGGFVLPIVFGYILKASGVWTTCFLLLAVLAAVCLLWMHAVIVKSASAHERTQGVRQ